MNSKTLISIIVVLIIAIPLASNVLYTVREGEQVVITQFGESIKTTNEAGLKIKTPFIQKVQRYGETDPRMGRCSQRDYD